MDKTLPFSASFTSIPPEVLLEIMKLVPDLRSLHSLALAVPAVYRLWGNFGAEILQAVTSNRVFTSPQLRDLVWLVALLRSAEIPTWSLDTFLEGFVKPTMERNRSPEPPCAVPAPTSCSFSVLGTASRIHDLTQLCLEHYLERLRGVQPRLRRLVSGNLDYRAAYRPYNLLVPCWRHRANSPYDTPYMGAASWVEEHIVLRAFWRLQLFYDFKRAAQTSKLTAWSHLDTARIAKRQFVVADIFPQYIYI